VDVQAGTVLAFGDITDQRQHLALLVYRDAAVLLGRAVEPANGGAFEAADGGDLRGFEVFGARELGQRADRLVARVTHHHVGHHVRVLDNLGFHRQILREGRTAQPAARDRPSTRSQGGVVGIGVVLGQH
jgi:hypothetical protein